LGWISWPFPRSRIRRPFIVRAQPQPPPRRAIAIVVRPKWQYQQQNRCSVLLSQSGVSVGRKFAPFAVIADAPPNALNVWVVARASALARAG